MVAFVTGYNHKCLIAWSPESPECFHKYRDRHSRGTRTVAVACGVWNIGGSEQCRDERVCIGSRSCQRALCACARLLRPAAGLRSAPMSYSAPRRTLAAALPKHECSRCRTQSRAGAGSNNYPCDCPEWILAYQRIKLKPCPFKKYSFTSLAFNLLLP